MTPAGWFWVGAAVGLVIGLAAGMAYGYFIRDNDA